MSEQSHEWTPENICEVCGFVSVAEPNFYASIGELVLKICDAHNAALAAEHKLCLGAIEVAAESQQQLAAERERNELGDCSVASIHIEHYFPKGYDPDAEPWKSIKAHHNATFAAEREETKRQHEGWVRADKVTTIIYHENEKLKQQLAAEREKVHRCEVIHRHRETIELFKDQRMLLVEALKRIQAFRHPWDNTHPCSQIARIADNALAKVKEI
jgi:hypothetical protein